MDSFHCLFVTVTSGNNG